MSLYVIATPIGNNDDMGLRSLSILREVEVIITEERKEGSKLLRHHGISGIPLEVLNEHTDREDIDRLVEICRTSSAALISDAGTPGFCDPGAELVSRCRKAGIRVQSVPGPSSLMSLLSICGRRLDQFFFRGFISAKTEERISQLAELKNVKIPVVLMDTPYRLRKILAELAISHPENLILLGLNLSQAEEVFLEGTAKKVLSQLKVDKAEFVLILLPSK
jgi:16S rRNA (cytidine1402-2'-O)-methyltransferase